MSSGVASQLTQMMVETVNNGTADESAIPGIDVAAKTGTAERSEALPPYAWFVSFAPADDPRGGGGGVHRVGGGGFAGGDLRRRTGGARSPRSVMESVIEPVSTGNERTP